MKRAICHDCKCKEGELHHLGCDMERCPFCGGQLISCECVYKLLDIDVSVGSYAYSHGPTDEQWKIWQGRLKEEGRIPWLQIPNMCALCGELWPEMFLAPDEEWRKYAIPQLQLEILCRACYDRIKTLFPNGWREAKGGVE